MFAGAFGGATHRMRFKDESPLGRQDAEVLSFVTGTFGGAISGICFKSDPFFLAGRLWLIKDRPLNPLDYEM